MTVAVAVVDSSVDPTRLQRKKHSRIRIALQPMQQMQSMQRISGMLMS